MTERIYYTDAYRREFDAAIVRVESRGELQALWLDRSAFYPTSGGQPCDTGTLDAARVVDVQDENGEVVHLVQGSVLDLGRRVHGTIDWTRRFDHMQQHTGQHVLSAAFVSTLNVPTVSFHMGTALSTIDVTKDLGPGEIALAEDAANAVVWEARRVIVSYADADTAKTRGLRKPSQREGQLRLVDIDGFDLSACGGSHVNSTSEIGIIVVTGFERFKGGTRVEFACGSRVLQQYRRLRDSVSASVKSLSVLPQEIPTAIERLQAEAREQRRTTIALEEQLATFRAQSLLAEAQPFGAGRAVFATVPGSAAALKTLATTLTKTPGLLVGLVSTESPCLVVVARARDGDGHCDLVIKRLLGRFGGRGGGRPDLAQAGGLEGAPEDVLTSLRECASTWIS